jgi:hypothetical protein
MLVRSVNPGGFAARESEEGYGSQRTQSALTDFVRYDLVCSGLSGDHIVGSITTPGGYVLHSGWLAITAVFRASEAAPTQDIAGTGVKHIRN